LPEKIPEYLDESVGLGMVRRLEGYYDSRTIDPAVIEVKNWGHTNTLVPSVSSWPASSSDEDISDEDMN